MSDERFERALRLHLPDARSVSQSLGVGDWKLAIVTVLNRSLEVITEEAAFSMSILAVRAFPFYMRQS